MTKILNQNIFFSNIGNQNIFEDTKEVIRSHIRRRKDNIMVKSLKIPQG